MSSVLLVVLLSVGIAVLIVVLALILAVALFGVGVLMDTQEPGQLFRYGWRKSGRK